MDLDRNRKSLCSCEARPCANRRMTVKSRNKLVLSWKRRELPFLVLYAIAFYTIIIRRSLQLSHDHYSKLYNLRPGWLGNWFNDVSDAQWRNFRGNLPILTAVFGIFALVANITRVCFGLKARGMSYIWLLLSLTYLIYLHGACTAFIISIASLNFLLVKIFARTKYFVPLLWIFNIFFMVSNRVYDGYSFSVLGPHWIYLDNFRGTFRWQICFNFVILRMVSFGYDYYWAILGSHFDHEKHMEHCYNCKTGKACYQLLQGKSVEIDKFSFSIYLCYLMYAPLYIAGPIMSFNAFASQLEEPQANYSVKDMAFYGIRWLFSLFLMELMTHMLYYNAFAISGIWRQLSPMDVFIIGYVALRHLRTCQSASIIATTWKDSGKIGMHLSINGLYMYIPLGGSRRKLLNIWVVFTFVALWHDLEWKLLSWAWLTCLFFIPELLLKSAANVFKVESAVGELFFREISALAGSITITCLMVANLVGFVIGPSGINWLISRFRSREGLQTVFGLLVTFYVGTKLMFHIEEARRRGQLACSK